MKNVFGMALCLVCGLACDAASALNLPTDSSVVPTITVVNLRKSCVAADTSCVNGSDPAEITQMLAWVWNTRKPSKTNPLIIKVDTGSYVLPAPETSGQYFCSTPRNSNGSLVSPLDGNVSIVGSGQGNTVLTGGGAAAPSGDISNGVITVRNCDNLTFQDLTIRTDSREGRQNGSVTGISWKGGGSSVWTNLSVEATQYGWVDAIDPSGEGCQTGLHYWFASRIQVQNDLYQFGYRTNCGDNWFFGGEISVEVTDPAVSVVALIAVAAGGIGSGAVHMYGTSVRSFSAQHVIASPAVFATYGQTGLWTEGGTIHMHGGLVSVQTTNPNALGVYGAKTAFSGGLIHTPETAYDVRTVGNVPATRVANFSGGMLHTPFVWPAGVNPPRSNGLVNGQQSGPDIKSLDGQDMYVETDCSDTLCNDTTQGSKVHLMVYSNACLQSSGSPWLDQITGKCRGQL